MANTIKFKRGLRTNLPTLNAGEAAVTLDTNEMFVGGEDGNVAIAAVVAAENENDAITKTTGTTNVIAWW